MLCLILIKKYLSIKFLHSENDSIGFVSATISVVYAVLAGFIILYVMNNFEKASDIASKEAAVIAKIFRNADRLPEPIKTKIQTAMTDYANTVIQVEWPNMSNDKLSNDGEIILDHLHKEITSFKSTNNQETIALQTIFLNLDELYNERSQRFDIGKAALSGDLWILLIISTLLTLFINSVIALDFYFHIGLQTAVTLMVSAILFLIIALDRPFLGYFSIQPDAFKASLLEMSNNPK